MSKGFFLTFLGVVVAGAAIGAIFAAQTGGSTQSAVAASRSGQGSSQAQGNNGGAPQGATPGATGSATGQSNRTQAAGGQAAGSNQNRPTVGTVKSIDGDIMTVTTQQGDTKVKLSGAKIEKTVDGTTDDLKSGQRVMVAGQSGPDGTVAASTIQITPVDAAQTGTAQPGAAPAATPGTTPQPAAGATAQPSQNAGGQQGQDQNGQQRQQRQRTQPAAGN